MILKGTHGTCASFAEKIRNNGFTIGPGRRGKGAYFWGYINPTREYASALAKAWWSQAKSMNKYDSASNQSYSELHVEIKTEDGRFLDLEEHTMKQVLLQFVNDIYKRKLPKERANLTRNAYDLFVAMIETQSHKKFDVIYATVNPPQAHYWEARDHFPSFDIIGMAPCYVVKNNRCIVLT